MRTGGVPISYKQLYTPHLHQRPTDELKMSSEELPQCTPDKLGEYTIIKDIAEGTFGKVKSTCNSITASGVTNPPS